MELWFSERHTPHVKYSIRVDRQLYSGYSEFQRIDVLDSKEMCIRDRFNTDVYELPPKTRLSITNALRREMIEIFSGRNVY